MSQTELSKGGSTRGFATGEKGGQFLQAAAASTHLSWQLPPWSTAGCDTMHSAARVLPVPQSGIYVAQECSLLSSEYSSLTFCFYKAFCDIR